MTTDFSGLIASAQDAPAFFDKDSKKGAKIAGFIQAIELRQTRDIKTKRPEVWEDNSPKQQFVIVVAPTDGTEARTIYVKWWGEQRKAFAGAILASGSDQPKVGGLLSVEYIGEGDQPTDKALSPTKLYKYAYNEENLAF